MQVKLEISHSQVSLALRDLRQIRNGAPLAITRAINRTLTATKTTISREVRKDYNLKAGTVKKHLRISKAAAWQMRYEGRYRGEVKAIGKPLKLRHWGARQTKKGVTVKILKSRGRLLYPRAWIHSGMWTAVKDRNPYRRVKTGRWGRSGALVFNQSVEVVFQRLPGAGRLPIYTPFGPSVPAAIENRAVMRRIEQEAQERFNRILLSRIDELLDKNGYPPKYRSNT